MTKLSPFDMTSHTYTRTEERVIFDIETNGFIKSKQPPFKLGDKVILKEGHFSPAKSNPAEGTRFACLGRIATMSLDGRNCTVDWSNGQTNSYSTFQLRHHGKQEIKGCKSIW